MGKLIVYLSDSTDFGIWSESWNGPKMTLQSLYKCFREGWELEKSRNYEKGRNYDKSLWFLRKVPLTVYSLIHLTCLDINLRNFEKGHGHFEKSGVISIKPPGFRELWGCLSKRGCLLETGGLIETARGFEKRGVLCVHSSFYRQNRLFWDSPVPSKPLRVPTFPGGLETTPLYRNS
jgi:hypothetical protein